MMKVPTVLQPFLKELARGKQSGDRLFGDVDRYWVRHSVRRFCRLASTPIVSPHGLRGTHGRLAVEAGISGDVVAASPNNFGSPETSSETSSSSRAACSA